MTEPTPDRIETIDLLAQQWQAVTALVADLDEDGWRTPTALPGWTVFDVVAHMIGTESWLLGEKPPPRDTADNEIDVRELPHVRNETAVMNEIWVDRLRPLTGARLLEMFGAITDRRLAMLGKMGDAVWKTPTPSPVGQVGYGRFMRVRLFDCWMHELDIADALGRTVDEGGPRGEEAFAEFAESLPRVVVKRGKAPDGSRIALDLTGPLARTLSIEVDGRAAYADAFDDPTVSVRLDSRLLVRLGGGRTTADEHSGDITITGDEEVGLRVVRNLAFTL
ncbi:MULTISPECIES: maleylpyruvate isomerase family mycothiol-dependent enzyme [Nocardia]|uniref:maleylpyruvate isomerase family mycothiol-dependent enzyme n=1 Tax=Nocardia TaxID=1817 RepID=UPI000D68650A|nr:MULTISPECIES: maleylpyruvate isomerase family mycothiol-dependent enzyme [Nocardia]